MATEAGTSRAKWRTFAAGAFFFWAGTVENGSWPILLPTIAAEYNVSASSVAWVLVTFALGMAGTSLTVGHLGDVVGHRRMALLGFATEAAMLVLAVLVPSLWAILLLRFVQGTGRATGLHNIQALSIGAFSREERGQAMGMVSGLAALGLLTGPLFAGLVGQFLGWRAVFVGIVGLYLVQLALTALLTREDVPPGRPVGATVREMDWAGAACFLLAIISLLGSVQVLRLPGYGAWGLALAAAGAMALGTALRLERRARHPVLDLGLFRSPVFSLAGVGLVVFSLTVGASTFLFPFYLQHGLGWSLAFSGAVLMALNIVQPWGSPLAGRFSDRLGARPLQAAGVAAMVAGLVLAARLGGAPPAWQVVAVLMVLGSAVSLFMPANNKTIYNAVPRGSLGTASAVSGVGRYVGQSMGAALGAVMLASGAAQGVPAAFQSAVLAIALGAGSTLALVLVAAALVTRPQRVTPVRSA